MLGAVVAQSVVAVSEICEIVHPMLNRLRIYARHTSLASKFGTTFASRIASLRTLNRLESATRTWSGDEELTVDILGHPMRGFDPWAMKLLFHELFLGHEYRFVSDVPDPVIIDCGANIGFSVLYFKGLYAAAHIYAYEPHPHAFRLLERNVEANGLDHVYARRAALSDRDGEAALYVHRNHGSPRHSLDARRGGPQRVTVEAQRLSTLLTTLDRVDVVKMDVEGAEWTSSLICARQARSADRVATSSSTTTRWPVTRRVFPSS